MSTKIAVVGMGYVGIPCAALLADVEGHDVTGIQRRSPRSGWKIDLLNAGKSPIEGDEPGLNELLAANGRQPETVRRSLMTNCCYGEDESEVLQKISARIYARLTLDQFRQRGAMVGTASQLVEQLGKWGEAGIQRVMLQWLDLDDLDGLESIASKVLPQIS